MSHRNCPGSKCPGFSSITACTHVEVSRTTFLVSKCLEVGAEVSQIGVLMPKCLVTEVPGNRKTLLVNCFSRVLMTAIYEKRFTASTVTSDISSYKVIYV